MAAVRKTSSRATTSEPTSPAPWTWATKTYGIWLTNSRDNLIGGSEPGSRNIISANGWTGVAIQYEQSTGNKVQGNYIGTDLTGTQPLGNVSGGVGIAYGASWNTIGTDGDGIADDREGNIISDTSEAHYAVGVGVGGQHNVVAGNLIGTDASGTVAIRNDVGVWISGSDNRIGTNGDGVSDELERNIVNSIEINGAYMDGGSQHNVIAGNYVGVDVTGNQLLGDGGGIVVRNDGSYNRIGTNADGISDELERNVIAGTNAGHALQIENATGNVAAGNFIGVGADGTTPTREAYGGILMRFGASGNTIGGAAETERNVISGNGWSGIWIDGEGSDENVILGNYIGLDALGHPLGNGQYGILLDAGTSRNTIGGADPGAGNVISANDRDGIHISGGSENVIQGNYIGTDFTGMLLIPNGTYGIRLEDTANNMIGGSDAGAGNVIGGSFNNIGLAGAASTGNVIQGNYIGVTSDGLASLTPDWLDAGVSERAILSHVEASHNTIGGLSPGEGNVIAGHNGQAIDLYGGGNNLIAGNRIGTNAAGDESIGNFRGLVMHNSPNNSVINNLISGNFDGVTVDGAAFHQYRNSR